MRHTLIACTLAGLSLGAAAQHAGPAGGHAGGHPAAAGGYAGMQQREIKALSAEQMAELRQGRGMGASLPAELNGVPGPLHVLELARPLQVSPAQRVALERITADMTSAARDLGHRVIAAEAELDAAFKSGSAEEAGIAAATSRIAALQGQLRAVHLVAHLKTRRLLTDAQVSAYNVARGYAGAHPPAR